MGKVKKFFSDINKSKFKSLYVKNFLFAVSILIVVLFAAITFNDIWLNIIGIFVLFGFSYLTFNVRAIEQNKLFYYRDDPSKPFHYDINERKAGSKDGKENPEI